MRAVCPSQAKPSSIQNSYIFLKINFRYFFFWHFLCAWRLVDLFLVSTALFNHTRTNRTNVKWTSSIWIRKKKEKNKIIIIKRSRETMYGLYALSLAAHCRVHKTLFLYTTHHTHPFRFISNMLLLPSFHPFYGRLLESCSSNI